MLRILVINEVSPNIKNRISMLIEKIIPVLSKKNKIEIFWLITDTFKKDKLTDDQNKLFYWKNFRTAKEVVEKINPSLIYLFPGQSIIDYSFLLTARFLKIPTCGWVEGIPMFAYNKARRKLAEETVRKFFEKKQIDEYKTSFRGINFIKKNLFFIRSARAIEKSRGNIISDLYQQFKRFLYFEMSEDDASTKFNCDLLLAESDGSVEYGITNGLSKDNMVLVGDPDYDLAFTKRNYIENKKFQKLNVLFITVNLSSYAKSNWSINKQNKMIEKLAKEYKKFKDVFSLSIKIHPVSENFNQYRKKIDEYDANIKLFQHENIYELIEKSDIVLTTATSTAGSIALIMKKPVILWNYFQVENDTFRDSGVVINCENISKINDYVTNANSFNMENELVIEEFIKKFYGDGNATQKIADAIENLTESRGLS